MLLTLGRAYMRIGNLESADCLFRKFIEHYPGCTQGYNELGILYFMLALINLKTNYNFEKYKTQSLEFYEKAEVILFENCLHENNLAESIEISTGSSQLQKNINDLKNLGMQPVYGKEPYRNLQYEDGYTVSSYIMQKALDYSIDDIKWHRHISGGYYSIYEQSYANSAEKKKTDNTRNDCTGSWSMAITGDGPVMQYSVSEHVGIDINGKVVWKL
jgi:hypothetical protein